MVEDYLEFGKYPEDVDEGEKTPSTPSTDSDADIEAMKKDITKLKNWIQLLEERLHSVERKMDDREEE